LKSYRFVLDTIEGASLTAAKVNVSFNVMISLSTEPHLTTVYKITSKTLIFKTKQYMDSYIGYHKILSFVVKNNEFTGVNFKFLKNKTDIPVR
tara:strand:- start:181 stop:459 length:279 start_codon:yes stop_codon:yes gene_type:complete